MARILLIEPDRLLAETYTKSLISSGHKVVPCAGALSAIHAADQTTPDLVILELQLIEYSGVEFLYEFRSYPEWQSVPVIIHTSVTHGEFSFSRTLLKNELGVHKYLYKPHTTLEKLARSVSEHLQVAV